MVISQMSKTMLLVTGDEVQVVGLLNTLETGKGKGLDWKELSPETQKELKKTLSKDAQKELGL